ncbi:MAG: (2Fe-2S)-binding protein [Candidatus Omnitrophica bacterium]|nr:(2Fe-2S)-binding protein [Candidatus Omnitrophota bacterium]
MEEKITLIINGQERTTTTDPRRPLLEVLREDFHLTGTKFGCGEGQCRACTVLIDGKRASSCVTPVGTVRNKAITTIEGLGAGSSLHPVQEAFVAEGAPQCGYCTPGMVLGAVALLVENPHPTELEIKQLMNGHLCRCGGYPKIIKAIQRAAGTATR